jgi:carbamoyl-phosphate synthase small subunit
LLHPSKLPSKINRNDLVIFIIHHSNFFIMNAVLVLQDGTILQGQPFGADADAVFELVFNTSMTGYQEILTDPSYRGQAVLFTCPHIGNVGINLEDNESAFPQVSAAVVRSLSHLTSNWRAKCCLSDWLAEHGVPGISGVDTRYLTRKLRDGGTQKAALSTRGTLPEKLLEMVNEWPGLDGRDTVKEITCPKLYPWEGDLGDKWVHRSSTASLVGSKAPQSSIHIVAYDFGIKRNILRHLASYGARVTVVPADTSAGDVLKLDPDGVFLSNGPGDPEGLPYAVDAVRGLLDSTVPILGICLGHQLLGMAVGGRKRRLKFGHHGGNHPVKHLPTGNVCITAQNHNYYIETDSLDPAKVEVTYLSLNDNSLEGMRLKGRLVLSVQFHPEAAPGPHDAHDVFGEFFDHIQEARHV